MPRAPAPFGPLRQINPFACGDDLGNLLAMIRNIIFDWSGTLVDDLPAVWQATNYVLTQCGRAEMSLEQFRAEFCLPFTNSRAAHGALEA